VAPIGVPIIADKATLSKTKPTTTKIKVEIDITKAQISEIQIVVKNEDGELESTNQRVEYENVPEYCFNCKAQGHSDENCRILHPELRGSDNKNSTNETQMQQQKKVEDLNEASTNSNGMQKGRNESSTIKGDKISGSEVKSKSSEENEGWTTVSKGKGKIKFQGNYDQVNQKTIETKNQFIFTAK